MEPRTTPLPASHGASQPGLAGSPPETSMTYIPLVRDENHWAVQLSRISVSGGSGGEMLPEHVACWNEPCVAVIDTGASGILAPSSHAYAIRQRQGSVQGDCSNFDDLPTIHFRLGGPGNAGVDVTLRPEHYIKRLKYTVLPSISSETCKTHFAPISLSGYNVPAWVLGVPFLQEYLVEFDRSTFPPRIGLARHAGPCPGESKDVTTLPAASSSNVQSAPAEKLADVAFLQFSGQ
eukprot:TRINITY_DN13850_c0_g1_i3.p1 TRINITY_DN13850_c0_g1~~TRINITY_DN13850_c0_g1_i3.p1  ORF type:complete len:235 (+),score=24.07 TRINITY_DN13850_c0_g1_i3:685-1389(+)